MSSARLSAIAAALLAAVVAVLANVVSTRHFRRWDVTTSQRYTLSPATIATLESLPATVHVWVLLGPGDPLGQSVRQILPSYQARSTQVNVKYIDPDRDP
ncbi:MAG: Gldg family protein, partial [Myxococcales bacterium]|nr:Gldg family protein [Myxococcales bacterium]